ncbi:hypothetical protein OsJ_05209 [Oryza sativa Japonica Group]|uniref:Uncharacterized protein n=1 Tax=Oryza sativa subsp. japonica TaxID=39947 RepID=B9F284_ORYSJ|nr:hypothetical protein OsJ_05209 [Oryza sativa Japonica Group]
MASTLRRAAVLRRAVSFAAPSPAVRRAARLPIAPRRPFSQPSAASGDQPPKSALDKDDKTDLKLKKHLQELEQMLDQIVSEHVKLHRLVHSSDRGYFERLLSEHGWPKCKPRDVFVWRCRLTTIFVASVMIGYMLPEIGYPS